MVDGARGRSATGTPGRRWRRARVTGVSVALLALAVGVSDLGLVRSAPASAAVSAPVAPAATQTLDRVASRATQPATVAPNAEGPSITASADDEMPELEVAVVDVGEASDLAGETQIAVSEPTAS